MMKVNNILDLFSSLGGFTCKATDLFIGATDVNENWKNTDYNIIGQPGQILNVAYYEDILIESFAGLLARVFDTGFDLKYPNQIVCSEGLRNTDMLHICYQNPRTTFKMHTPGEEPAIIDYADFLSFSQLVELISSWIDEQQRRTMKLKTVFIDCLSIYAGDNDPFMIQQALERLAHEHDVIIIAGWQISDIVPGIHKIVDHLSTHNSNLAFLTKEDDNVTFTYGTPEKRCIYILDNRQLAAPAPKMKWNMMLEQYLPALLKQPLKRYDLQQALWGAFGGTFSIETIKNKITEALADDIIINDGGIIRLSDTPAPKKHRKGAISMLTNPYIKQHGFKVAKRKAFVHFGDFKLITDFNDIPQRVTKTFTQLVLLSVMQGKSLSQIKCEAEQKNILYIDIANKQDADSFKAYIMNFCKVNKLDTDITYLQIDPKTKCIDFLGSVNSEINGKNFNFVFIVGIENLSFDCFSIEQIITESKQIAKRNNVAIIGCYTPASNTLDILKHTEDLCCVGYALGESVKIYSATTCTKDWFLAIRFSRGNNGKLCHTDSRTQLKAFYKAVFGGYKGEGWISFDSLKYCWEEPISLSQLKQAQSLGFVQIDKKYKQFKYIGE